MDGLWYTWAGKSKSREVSPLPCFMDFKCGAQGHQLVLAEPRFTQVSHPEALSYSIPFITSPKGPVPPAGSLWQPGHVRFILHITLCVKQ